MKYGFKDMLTAEVYESTKVMFILGKYDLFNNLVADELKAMCTNEHVIETDLGIGAEFGIEDLSTNESVNSIDFDTFLDVNGVASVNGLWYCKTELKSLTKTQKNKLNSYIKNPSDTGILVVVSNDWKDYKEYLKNKTLQFSKSCHIMELSFPHRETLKILVKQMFEEKDIEITPAAVDMFLTKMSSAYTEYDDVIDKIAYNHTDGLLDVKDLKHYMSGIEHYELEDFIEELTKPLSSDKTNRKKVLKIMSILSDSYGSVDLVYKILNILDTCIDFRVMINNGTIPITINYFFKDVVNELGPDNKYSKLSEWKFRKNANLAAKTSLRDWEYMKLILFNAIKNVRVDSETLENRCKRALYALCTRSVLSANRIDNIVGLDNILNQSFINLNNLVFDEQALLEIKQNIELANQ